MRLVLILGIAAFTGVAAAEPPTPEPPQFKSLIPIGGVAGGLVPVPRRVP